jgi:hypothetical protein
MAKKGSGIAQVRTIVPGSPLAEILGVKTVKGNEILARLWHGPKMNKKKPTGHSINKLGLKGKLGDGHTLKGKKGGQLIHTGRDPLWKEFANGKKIITMNEVLKLAYEDLEPLD